MHFCIVFLKGPNSINKTEAQLMRSLLINDLFRSGLKRTCDSCATEPIWSGKVGGGHCAVTREPISSMQNFPVVDEEGGTRTELEPELLFLQKFREPDNSFVEVCRLVRWKPRKYAHVQRIKPE